MALLVIEKQVHGQMRKCGGGEKNTFHIVPQEIFASESTTMVVMVGGLHCSTPSQLSTS